LAATTNGTSQNALLEEIDPESKENLLDLLYRIDKNRIYQFDKPPHEFVKIFVLSQDSGASLLEGESLESVYILIGEFGEYPAGRMYLIKDLYNVKDCDFKEGEVKILYGPYNEKRLFKARMD
jgi:hypothetical protein